MIASDTLFGIGGVESWRVFCGIKVSESGKAIVARRTVCRKEALDDSEYVKINKNYVSLCRVHEEGSFHAVQMK